MRVVVSFVCPSTFGEVDAGVRQRRAFTPMNDSNDFVVFADRCVERDFGLRLASLSVQCDVERFDAFDFEFFEVIPFDARFLPTIERRLHNRLVGLESSEGFGKLFANFEFRIFQASDLTSQL